MATTSSPESGSGRTGSLRAPCALWRFGSFEVDPETEELRKSGVRLHLPSQPFQVLMLLLRRAGDVVSREELQQWLWPEGPPADSDHSLSTAVNRLRTTLCDTAGEARYVETLPRRGYRFVAPVERVEREAPCHSGVEIESVPPASFARSPSTRRWWVPALAIASIVAAVVTLFWILSSRSLPRDASQPQTLTDLPGTETTPTWSPNGGQIAFAWDGGEGRKLDIYLLDLLSKARSRVTRIAGNAFAPAFSPDGGRIAFYRRAGDSAYLHIADSSRREMTETAGFGLNVGPDVRFSVESARAATPDLAALSWSPDAREIAYVDKSRPDAPYSIFVLLVSAWRGEALTWPPSGIRGDGAPAFSPDGQRLAFIRSESESNADLYLLSLNGGSPRRLTSDRCRVRGIVWSSDGKSLIFSSERSGEPALWRIAVESGVIERVPQVREAAVLPAISAKTGNLAYVRWPLREEIVRISLQPALGSRQEAIAEPAGVESFSQDASNPEFSPDGSRVAFSAGAPDRNKIWVADADGKNAVALTNEGGYSGSPRWSPDGRFIAFDFRATNNFGVYDAFVVDAKGGKPRALTTGPGQNTRPAWSSDGRSLYFASDRSGTQQIWKIPAEGGVARQITRNGGSEAEESLDGRTLYYSRRSVPGLWSIPADGGAETLVIPDLQWENSRNWTVMPGAIYYLFREGSRASDWTYWLKRYDVRSGVSKQAIRLGNLPIVNGRCSVSSGMQTLLCVQERRTETDLALLTGFQ